MFSPFQLFFFFFKTFSNLSAHKLRFFSVTYSRGRRIIAIVFWLLTMIWGLITPRHNLGFAGREAGARCLKQQVTSVQHTSRILCQNSNSSCCRSEGQKLPHSWIHWTSKAGHATLSYSLLTILNARVKLPFVEDKKGRQNKNKTFLALSICSTM